VDFRINVIYNWCSYSTNGGEGGNYNVVSNYYKYGSATSNGKSAGIPTRSMIMNPSKNERLPYPKVYLHGNVVDGYPEATANNWRGISMSGGSPADTGQSKVAAPFPLLAINEQDAVTAYNEVLRYGGASLPARDTLDQRIVNDVRNRTGRLIDVQGGYPHATPYEQTVNAWPVLRSKEPPADTDRDGMPDDWETNHALDPRNAKDAGIIAANGYNNLENYLHSLVKH
jgi:hypothetical protein